MAGILKDLRMKKRRSVIQKRLMRQLIVVSGTETETETETEKSKAVSALL